MCTGAEKSDGQFHVKLEDILARTVVGHRVTAQEGGGGVQAQAKNTSPLPIDHAHPGRGAGEGRSFLPAGKPCPPCLPCPPCHPFGEENVGVLVVAVDDGAGRSAVVSQPGGQPPCFGLTCRNKWGRGVPSMHGEYQACMGSTKHA